MRTGWIWLALGLAPASSWAVTSAELEQAVQAYDRLSSIQDPIRAGMRGDAAALARWPDDSPQQVTARVRELGRLRAVLDTAPQGLGPEQALTRDLLLERMDTATEGARFDEERIPFQSGEGFYTLPESTAATTPIRDEADARAWLARLETIPAYYAIEVANMRRGIATRFTQPRITVETAVKTVGGLAAEDPEKSALLLPYARTGNGLTPKRVGELRQEALAAIRDAVRPAQRALLEFFSKEYLPKARPGLGMRTVPDGEAYYRYLVRFHTTTRMSPDEVYTLGEREVARIRSEMDAIRREAAFQGTL
ncbi:MAG TPA: DUF885 family protein, partial [Steroidobacteraceae bacterium]|nr:DUF885 family protein [Steroidobacteraceae bacterium]